MAGMDPEMREAFERAVRSSSGYFHGVSEAVLARLVEMGIAHQEVDEEAHQLTDKGWELGTLAAPVSPEGIKFRVFGNARWQIPVELVDPAPDTKAPGFPMVRPKSVTIDLTPNRAGFWCVSSVAVWGPKVKDGKVATKREYSALFSDLMNEITGAPSWLRDICQEWADRANGRGVPLTDRQVYDLNNRLHSNLGLQPTRKVLEDVLGTTAEAAPVREPVKEVSPQRSAFDSALRVLLMRENLDGTEWAIRQLRESADAAAQVAADDDSMRLDKDLLWMTLRVAADELEKMLDKRTAELATREH